MFSVPVLSAETRRSVMKLTHFTKYVHMTLTLLIPVFTYLVLDAGIIGGGR